MGLSRDAILELNDRTTKDVDVPEWGGTVTIREWGLPERAMFSEAMEGRGSGEKSLSDVMALCVVLSVVDGNGDRIFQEKDVPLISRKSGKAVERIFAAATSLNRLSAREIKDVEGN